jgi:PilZ domain
MSEKRRYRRSPITGWVEVVVEETGETLLGYVKDISMKGVGLYVQKVLPSGTRVELSLHFFGNKRFETVKGLRGVVAWCFEGGMFHAFGVCFEKVVASENYPALHAFLGAQKKEYEH